MVTKILVTVEWEPQERTDQDEDRFVLESEGDVLDYIETTISSDAQYDHVPLKVLSVEV